MAAVPGTVKLFVSSTFEDMHAERDRLNRFVFPEVRTRCRMAGVDFLAVDLRWGVTREETERQGTTDVCLREVDRCLPFFLGLVGDRYGWVPAPERVPLAAYRATREAAGDDDRALLERAYTLDETTGEPAMRLRPTADEDRPRLVHLWEAAGLPGAGRSLTEIEIDRALEAAGSRALFFLRDPPVHVQPGFPQSLLPVFTSPEGEPRRRLAQLRQRLAEHHGARPYAPRYAGMRVDATYVPRGLSNRERRVLEDGVFTPDELDALTERLRRVVERHGRVALDGLDAWGEQVVEDLWARIEDVAGGAARHDGGGHERFLRERTRLFVGRDDLVRRAVEFAAADERDDLLVFTGPPGSGKSALMAECATACRREDPGAVAIAHFVGAEPGPADVRVTIRSRCERLRDACGLDDEVPAAGDALEFALATFLEHAAATRRVMVFLDALDQLDPAGGSHELRWLPTRLPPNVRVVVSTLPGTPLDRLRDRARRIVELPPLAAADREELIRRTLADRGKRLTASQIERLLDTADRPDAVRPLYLLVALEELSIFGDFGGLDRRLASLPMRLADLFDQVLARLELDHGRPPTEGVLRLLAAARSGLLEPEIRDLLAARGIPPLAWARLRLALDFYLRPVDERDEGLTGFYHDGLRAAVDRRYGDAAGAHRELAGYFLARARAPEGWDASAARPLAELAFHHVRGGLATGLARMLEDPRFLDARLRAGPPHALLADFDLLLEAREPGIDAAGLRWIGDALRLAAHLLARDPAQLASQLWARLAPRASPSVDALRAALRRDRSRPWLRPYSAGLTVAGSPLQLTLSGMNSVSGVVVSPDDALALCHDDDSILWIWDLRSGLLRRRIETDRDRWIVCSARHPTRPVAVAGIDEGGLLVVDMDAGEVVAELPAGGELQAVAVSADGSQAWTAHDGHVEIRGLAGDGTIRTVDAGGDVTAIAAAARSRAFLAVDGAVQEWDLESATCLRTLGEAADTVTSLALSPRRDRLAAGRADGRIDLWDLAGGAAATPPGHRDRAFRTDLGGLAFTPDGRRLVSGSWDETVRVWSASTGAPISTLRGHSMAVYALAVFDAGRRAVSASKDGTLRVWDLAAEPLPEPEFRHAGAVDALAARHGIAVTGGRDRRLAVWELETGRAIRHWDAHAGDELHEGWVMAVALDRDGAVVHSAGKDGALKSWTAGGTLVDAVEGDWGSSGNAALAEDAPLLVADDGGYDDVRVSVWRPGRATRLGRRVKVGSSRAAIGVSPDGRVAVAADLYGGFAVLDPKGRRVVWTHPGREDRRDYAEDIAVGPGGRRAIVGMSDGRVELWDLERRRRRRTFRLHADRAWSVAISPDGAFGCSAGWDRVLHVWALETGEVIASYASDDFWAACIFAGHPRRVLAADERGGLHVLWLENR